MTVSRSVRTWARWWRSILVVLPGAALAAVPVADAMADTAPAPVRTAAGQVLPEQYVVVLAGAPAAARTAAASERARAWGIRADRRFSHALGGYAARLSAAQLDRVRRDPAVAYVVPDTVVRAARRPR